MRVAVLTEFGDWSASTRFRALQHVPRLATRLGTVDVYCADDRPLRKPGRVGQARYFASHGVRYLKRWQQLSRVLNDYDAVYVQRGLYAVGPRAVAKPLESFKGRVVFDLDDAVFEQHAALAQKSKAAQWLYGPQQSLAILDRADAVITSTPALADALPTRRESVTILPTVPDVSIYKQSDQLNVAPVVGWAGTNGGLPYLEPLREVFTKLERDSVGKLRVVSSAPWDGPSEFREWKLVDEPTLFSEFAVGIMPLPDMAYTRAKAGFKLLQYMAAGVPVVASPVGINTELVETSGGGFLADTPTDWEDRFRTLLTNPELRLELGRKGRAFIENYANLDAQADVIAALLDPSRIA